MNSEAKEMMLHTLEQCRREIEWLTTLLHRKLASSDCTIDLIDATIIVVKEIK